jgi:hypothetical protein
VLDQPLGQAAFGERRLPGQHVEPGTPQRVQVAARVGRPAVARLLRRDVVHGADGGAAAGDAALLGTGLPGESQVGQLDDELVLLAADEEVGRLDVAVDDVLQVGVVQGAAGLDHDLPRLLRVQPALALDVLVQVDAVDELHGEEVGAVGLGALVQGDDVLVAELLGGPGLAAEALDHGGLGGHLGRHHLEGDLAAGLGVARPVDGPHAAAGDVREDLVLADPDGPARPLRWGFR